MGTSMETLYHSEVIEKISFKKGKYLDFASKAEVRGLRQIQSVGLIPERMKLSLCSSDLLCAAHLNL